MRLRAGAFVYLFGPGIWRWRVRAEFPKTGGFATGPWSAFTNFTRTISEPANVRTSLSGNHLLLSRGWKLGAKNFRVQVSSRQDFNTLIEDVTTDNTSYAPLLPTTTTSTAAPSSGEWRLMDENRNTGEFAPPQRSTSPALADGRHQQPRRRRWTRVTVSVTDPGRRPVLSATVRVSGPAFALAAHARTAPGASCSGSVR